ncbi:hypothetical protein ASD54_08705 [Rhizobium sp. Root149]|uniref:hypothetical protein n=1 Tax=Rhizobium sp. Root149 TaxID=1736473 RepID=UPI000713B1B3|nr:hypothetical protein [Rhizobium sp. Root149]KQZ50325.1 hypothetical protein ASD54_08705 [Rhizobium sp. Root149]
MPTLTRYDVKTKTTTTVEIAPLPPSKPYLRNLSRRQFYQALALGDDPYITEAEALAAVASGMLPAAVEAIVSNLPSETQFSARMLLVGATTFVRSHPLVGAFGVALGMSESQLDEFWLGASKLG